MATTYEIHPVDTPLARLAAGETLDQMLATAQAVARTNGEGCAITAEMYAQREVEFHPTKTLEQWRGELATLLAGGWPFGKIGFTSRLDVINAMAAWEDALGAIPIGAHPRHVYEVAPKGALSYLGF